MSEKEKDNALLYSAPWVLPIAGPAVREGAVAVRDGHILAVGPAKKIRASYPAGEEVRYFGVLMPALINAHIHLELSHLGGIDRPEVEGRMCRWIEELIRERGRCPLSADERVRLRREVLDDQHRSGVVLVADIGNEASPPGSGDERCPRIEHFQEFLAPTKTAADAALAAVFELPDAVAATAHACYSTLPELICALKKRANRLARVYPIHVAESAEEIEFIRSLSGPFRTFLERRGAWDKSFSSGGHAAEGVVTYLHALGVLDDRTLCVHCVHIQEKEVKLLAESGCHVCLCPGSNRFLRVGRAPVEMMLRHGLLPAIGTDSAASNDRLDIWDEMRILRQEHPGLEPKTILAMATAGGSAALHCQGDFGSLFPRKKAVFLAVGPEELARVDSEPELNDILTASGRPSVVEWIGC